MKIIYENQSYIPVRKLSRDMRMKCRLLKVLYPTMRLNPLFGISNRLSRFCRLDQVSRIRLSGVGGLIFETELHMNTTTVTGKVHLICIMTNQVNAPAIFFEQIILF